MRRLLALWEKESLALSRDVLGLAVLFLMPAAFIVVMSLALSDVFKGGTARQAEFAVMAADPKLADSLERSLAGDGFRAAPAPADEAAARDGVRRGTPSLVLVVPRDFERALSAPFDARNAPPKLTLLADPVLPPAQLLAFRQRVLGVTLSLRVVAMMRRAGIAADADAFDLKRAATLSVVERREGTLARLVSLRVPFSMLLLGKVGPYFVVNLTQAVLMLLAGRALVPWFGGETLAFPARWDLLAAVTACTSFAAIGWGLLVAVCSRTLEQATVIGGVGNILAAAVGGIMVPRFVMPEAMQKLSEVSPMAWALDGFHAVILRGGGAADIAAPCAKLLALAAALLAAALWVHHRRRVLTSAQ